MKLYAIKLHPWFNVIHFCTRVCYSELLQFKFLLLFTARQLLECSLPLNTTNRMPTITADWNNAIHEAQKNYAKHFHVLIGNA